MNMEAILEHIFWGGSGMKNKLRYMTRMWTKLHSISFFFISVDACFFLLMVAKLGFPGVSKPILFLLHFPRNHQLPPAQEILWSCDLRMCWGIFKFSNLNKFWFIPIFNCGKIAVDTDDARDWSLYVLIQFIMQGLPATYFGSHKPSQERRCLRNIL